MDPPGKYNIAGHHPKRKNCRAPLLFIGMSLILVTVVLQIGLIKDQLSSISSSRIMEETIFNRPWTATNRSAQIPPPDSLCYSGPVSDFCNNQPMTCWTHERDVDEKLIKSALRKNASTDHGVVMHGCRMLWFAAMHESEEIFDGRKQYAKYYSAALKSALLNAHDSLQPVLILGRLGMPYQNSSEHKKLGRWAEEKGVKVIYSERLSFQEDVNRFLHQRLEKKWWSTLQGAFLRLDIPFFVKKHSLFSLPNVCDTHILYTDVDIIFSNTITQHDIQILRELTGDAIATYGRESKKQEEIINTGVMVMNVDVFSQELTQFHAFSRSHPDSTYEHDQDMMNLYMRNNLDKFKLLPMHYNWKPYWQLEPSSFSQVKIIHMHGPKPGRVLDEVANCNLTWPELQYGSYRRMFFEGVCCDKGRTAKWTIDMFRHLQASTDELL